MMHIYSIVRRKVHVHPAFSTVNITHKVHPAPLQGLFGSFADLSPRPGDPRNLQPVQLLLYPSHDGKHASFSCAPLSWLGSHFVGSADRLGVHGLSAQAKRRLFSSQPGKKDDELGGTASGGGEDLATKQVARSGCLWSDQVFTEMIEELRAFHAKFRSFRAPMTSRLGKWVVRQRNNLKRFKQGRKSPLTEDQAQQLTELGLLRTKYDDKWLVMFNALEKFYARHGHCNVPACASSKYDPLAQWVSAQRHSYHARKRSMTPERIRMLEELSFEWKSGRHSLWWDTYELLHKHWEEHGDINVSIDSPEGPRLTKWVSKQRKLHKQIQRGRQNELTGDRIEALNKLGFIWDKHDATWMDRLSEMRKFRELHGHCRVPKESDGKYDKLHAWVRTQRYARKQGDAGARQPMSKKRIKLLADLGFLWDPAEDVWHEHFEELRDFCSRNGHFMVPKGTSLYNWVSRQRAAYKKFRAGKKSSLTPERIARLESIDLKWTCTESLGDPV